MITVVSGLPRSGTSLMMQMLQAGGHPILSDAQRPADADNPRGYLEFAQVRQLERDAAWVGQAEGQAVKIVSPLLLRLPSTSEYRVIFMRRDLDEVLQSQERMLERRGQPTGPDRSVMRRHFERHLETLATVLAQRPEFTVLDCPYADVVRHPEEYSTKIAEFLARPLDVSAMMAAVDPELYRQRSPQ